MKDTTHDPAGLLPAKARLDWAATGRPVFELGGGGLVRSQYYELRLQPGLEQIDYLVAFGRRGAQVLRDLVAEASGRAPFLSPAWRDVERLLDGWTRPGTLLRARCPWLWFEYDDFEHATDAVPSISVCLTPRYRPHDDPSAWEAEDLELAREALAYLGAPPAAAEPLPLVFAALPDGARWIHLSYMLGRPARATKLYGALPRQELRPYLELIGWAGELAAIEDALERFYPERLLGTTAFIDLNLENFRDPRRASLGLAVAQQHLHFGPDPDPTRQAILEAWTAAGLCDATKTALVRAWPASSEGVPVPPFEREQRFLDVKLVWQAGHGFTPKAYVGRERLHGLV